MQIINPTIFILFFSIVCFAADTPVNFIVEKLQDDLYFVMERVTSASERLKWKVVYDTMEYGKPSPLTFEDEDIRSIHESMEPNLRRIGLFETDDECSRVTIQNTIKIAKQDGIYNEEVFGTNIRSGAREGGQGTIEIVAEAALTDRPVDLGVAYMWASTDAPHYPFRPEDIFKLEMIMTVTVGGPLFFYTWHMGITRNVLWKGLNGQKVHRGISVGMHQCAAKHMKSIYPSLLYVRSELMESMYKILVKELAPLVGKKIFFIPFQEWVSEINLNEHGIIVYKPGDEVILYGMDRHEKIWQGSAADFDFPRFRGGGYKFLADINDLIAA